ncbi:hypothetical protein FisN_8Lu030 [Fistulifera solaris]|uniref:Uncharacterized protein n=1 Tax=Fistulifera solaris TaxID=1519565 RepID=A0A1Z5JDG4_FISSO|nr:hypothetical protein FisN_8Lu030 [Fistulifera solaris]|eukprot:GAX11922.1 hypothetical protein FisN_8Lu030 [Fistulifera solaris]
MYKGTVRSGTVPYWYCTIPVQVSSNFERITPQQWQRLLYQWDVHSAMGRRSSFTPQGVLSISIRVALRTIRQRYRKDVFSVETKGNEVRLLRQSRPLTTTFFYDLHYMPEDYLVVGILTPPKDDGTCEAQILLDPYGRILGEQRYVTVTSYKGRSTAASLSQQFRQRREERIKEEDTKQYRYFRFGDRFVDCASFTLCCGGSGWIA